MLPMFLSGSEGKLFTVYHAANPGSVSKNAVVLFPPFAEELNKSRRMISLQSKAFTELGYDVLLIDLYGAGDSEGEFSDATWGGWLKDVEVGINWLVDKGVHRFVFWGLRLGALLAMQSARMLNVQVNTIVLWQPVLSGKVSMNQFLRLRMAADLVNVSDKKITTKDLRESIERNEAVEVAGYTLPASLVTAIDALELVDMAYEGMPPVGWFEVSVSERPIAHVSRKLIDAWSSQGHSISDHMDEGESFWVTPEISISTGLLKSTSQFLKTAE